MRGQCARGRGTSLQSWRLPCRDAGGHGGWDGERWVSGWTRAECVGLGCQWVIEAGRPEGEIWAGAEGGACLLDCGGQQCHRD